MYGKYTFVSCWTEIDANEKESIALWNMYSSTDSGVLVRLKSIPFEPETASLCTKFVAGGAWEYMLPARSVDDLLIKVNYTDDEDLIAPKIINELPDKKKEMIYRLGIHKNTYWDFQKEWRYILRFKPATHEEQFKKPEIASLKFFNAGDLPFKYFSLPIDNDAFADMQVITSPKLLEGYRVILEALREKYNSTMIIKKSQLENKIR